MSNEIETLSKYSELQLKYKKLNIGLEFNGDYFFLESENKRKRTFDTLNEATAYLNGLRDSKIHPLVTADFGDCEVNDED